MSLTLQKTENLDKLLKALKFQPVINVITAEAKAAEKRRLAIENKIKAMENDLLAGNY